MDETNIGQSKEIVITTQRLEEWVMIQITDNGFGISKEKKALRFEAFFTTKPMGISTGLGLSISYQIVVEKHGGKLTCESDIDKGTTFAIALPIKQESNSEKSAKIPNCIFTQNFDLFFN